MFLRDIVSYWSILNNPLNSLSDLSKNLDQHWNDLWWKKRVVYLLKVRRLDDAAAVYDEFSSNIK